jgi:nucleoside-diphosphate-sugar epimerase
LFVAGKKILVTGGSGFIGAHLTKRLVELGNEVVVVDNFRRSNPARLESIKDRIQLIDKDVREICGVAAEIDKLDCVFHLAAINGTQNFYNYAQDVLDVALRGTLQVFDLAVTLGAKEIFVASSSEVYNEARKIPTPENIECLIPDIWNPRFSYGGGKLAQELITANYYNDHFERKVIFRPHNIYGQDMGDGHVIPNLVSKIKEAQKLGRESIEILGDGEQTRSFMHIDDFIEGLMTVYHWGAGGEIYHIGVEEEVSIKHLLTIIQSALGTELSIKNMPAPEGETSRRCPDTSKLRRLGFVAKHNLTSGINEILRAHLGGTGR